MANYRKIVRNKLTEAVAHATTGFNAKLAALAASYGVAPFTINWSAPSRSFAQSYLNPAAVEVSNIIEFPGAVLYTSSAVHEKSPKGFIFAGSVTAHLDLYLLYRALTEIQTAGNDYEGTEDTESIADAVEDAMTAAIEAGKDILTTAGVRPRDYRVDREPVTLYGDGHGQRVLFTFDFGVNAS